MENEEQNIKFYDIYITAISILIKSQIEIELLKQNSPNSSLYLN